MIQNSLRFIIGSYYIHTQNRENKYYATMFDAFNISPRKHGPYTMAKIYRRSDETQDRHGQRYRFNLDKEFQMFGITIRKREF